MMKKLIMCDISETMLNRDKDVEYEGNQPFNRINNIVWSIVTDAQIPIPDIFSARGEKSRGRRKSPFQGEQSGRRYKQPVNALDQ